MKDDTSQKIQERSVRIRKIREYFCFGKNVEFANKLGIKSNHASSICNGKVNIGLETIEKVLAAFPDISRRWLLTGEGPMLNPSGADVCPSAVHPDDGQTTKEQRTSSESASNPLPSYPDIIAAKDAVIISLNAQLSAMQRTIDTQESYIARLEKTLKDYEE